MPSKKLKSPLLPDRYYHVYNRGNNREILFYENEDFYFFLNKLKQYVSPFAEIYAFCLLPNHFHILLKTRHETINAKSAVPNQLRKVFICHTKRINLMQKRTGGLFTKNYNRIEITDDSYLHHVVNYIHKNPVKHRINSDFENYTFSSYRIITGNTRTSLRRDEVIYWFGGISQFVEFHKTVDSEDDLRSHLKIKDDDDRL